MPGRLISFRSLITIAVALIGAAVVAIGVTVVALRNDALSDAARDAGNIATVLAEEGASSVQSVDIIATELKDELLRLSNGDTAALQDLLHSNHVYDMLRERRARVRQADFIALVDMHGKLATTSRMWPTPPADLSDRDYFRHSKSLSGNSDSLFISGLTVNRISGMQTLFFSRRIAVGDTFLGVVLVGLPLTYFQHLYSSIASLPNQSFLLLRRNGTVLIRHPDNFDRAGEKIPPGSPWYDLISNGGGQFRSPGYFDYRPRIVATRQLRDYPLAVNVAVSENNALERWRHRALLIGLGTAIAILCSALLLRALSMHVRRLVDSEASLAEREAKLAENSEVLEHTNALLDSALHHMSQGLAMFDRNEVLMLCNERYLELYGLSPDIVKPGCTLRTILEHRTATNTFSAEIDQYIETLQRQTARGEINYTVTHLGDGRSIAVYNRAAADGGWVATHEDVTERMRAAARVAHMARHDALTDLANRVLFRERMEDALARLQSEGKPFSVFVFDLDMFKAVNDSLGHPVGDTLLKVVAQRLLGVVRPCDTVGRLGGDEFAIIQLCDSDQRSAAVALAQRLLTIISAPYQIDGHEIVIGTSIGIAMALADGSNVDELLKNADLALYRAKSEGRKDYRFFEVQMDSALRLRRSLEIDLRHALAREEFEIHYQPVIDVATGRPDGAEALLRWRHPLRGLVTPDKFIPLAEETGMIVPIGEWVLQHACAAATQWPSDIKLSVNLSPVQFHGPNLASMVADALRESGLPAHRLELEVTESVLLEKSAGAIDTLHQLKKMGVGIVLDDFGTGYSSLHYLRMFPFDKIKIDQSFVAEMPNRADCAAIVCAITGLAHNLDIETTAEGVETEEQFLLLRTAGCTHAQGYLFSRPRPFAELDFAQAMQRAQIA
jgi:diguanylate cyclase (GGDEF)-like protein